LAAVGSNPKPSPPGVRRRPIGTWEAAPMNKDQLSKLLEMLTSVMNTDTEDKVLITQVLDKAEHEELVAALRNAINFAI
jgi:hypothetical protein